MRSAMRSRFFFLIAACVLSASAVEGRDVDTDVTYPVPILPLDGWASACVTMRKFIRADREFEIASSTIGQRATESVRKGELKDVYPHRYSVVFHLANENQDRNPLRIRIGGERGWRGARGFLRFGRSVVGLTTTSGAVMARKAQLAQIMAKPQGTWDYGSPLPDDVEIIEHASAKLLPDSWMGYDLLQAMVIEDFPYSTLSSAQEDAIVQWVENGGTILVSPGKSGMAFQSSLLRRLVDFQVKGSETLSVAPEFGDAALATATRWDVTLDGARHKPLAEVASCGLGTVAVFKYDILRPPFSQWPALTNVLRRTCAVPVKRQRYGKFPLRWSRREEKLPGPPTIAAILGAYLLVVGPINYVLLRRRKKLVLMPFTIGAIAVVSTVSVIAYGYISRGMTTELREFTLVQTHPGRTTAFAVSQKGIYASSNRAFRLSFSDSTALRKIARDSRPGYMRAGLDESPLRVADTGDGTVEAQFTSLMWDVFLIEARAPVPEFGNLRIETRGNTTTVCNAAGADLENCWVKDGKNWYRIGKLAKGATAACPKRPGRPPTRVVKALSGLGGGRVVIGKAAPGGKPAIPYEIKKGRAGTVQSETYVMGWARPSTGR